MKPKKTAGIYCRISHEDQSEYSLPSQKSACEALVAAKGYQTSSEFLFIDDGGLSTELDRVALSEMREAARAGVIGMVVIYDLDRLARKLSHQLLLIEEFEKRGVAVEFVKGPTDATPEGRMMLQVKGMFAEFEREKIRERTSRGQRQRAKQGKVNNRPPYGYTPIPPDLPYNPNDPEWKRLYGLLTPIPERVAVVRTIFKRLITGMTCGEVAESLNSERVPPPASKPWLRATILQIANRRPTIRGSSPGERRKRRNRNDASSQRVPARISGPARSGGPRRNGFLSASRRSSTRALSRRRNEPFRPTESGNRGDPRRPTC